MLRRAPVLAALSGSLLVTIAAGFATPDLGAAAGDAVIKVSTDEAANAAHIRASIDIAASPAIVWEVISNCERSPRVIPGLESCRVIKRDGAGRWDIRELFINWSAIMPRVRSVVRSTYDNERRLRFKLVEGDLRISEGEWRIEPTSDARTTRLHYDAKLAPNFPVPQFMVNQALDKDIPAVLRAIQRESQADAKKK